MCNYVFALVFCDRSEQQILCNSKLKRCTTNTAWQVDSNSYEHCTHYNTGSCHCCPSSDYELNISHTFDSIQDQANSGQWSFFSAQPCAKLSHIFLWHVCERYWLSGAQSERGSAADQPRSAETRSAAPDWDTGKVRMLCNSFIVGFYRLLQCQNNSTPLSRFATSGKYLLWTYLLNDKKYVTTFQLVYTFHRMHIWSNSCSKWKSL